MSINQTQDEILEEFAMLNGDLEKILFHIASLGQRLPVMSLELKTDQNLIKGCHSKVWLAAMVEQTKMHYQGDSDTIISKGLVSLLIRIFDGQPQHEILKADLYFPRRHHLERFIGTKRSNGFSAMFDQIKYYVPKNI